MLRVRKDNERHRVGQSENHIKDARFKKNLSGKADSPGEVFKFFYDCVSVVL